MLLTRGRGEIDIVVDGRKKSQYLFVKKEAHERKRRKLICSGKISKTQLMGYSRERFELDNEIY